MKIQQLIIFTLLFSFFTQNVSGQNKPCNNFDCAYKKAETFLKQAAYKKALDNLDSAEGYLTDANTKEKEQIKQLRRRLFVAIEKEKEEAKRARDEAKRQAEIAKSEKERADQKTEELQKQIEIAQIEKKRADLKTEEAQTQTQIVAYEKNISDSLYKLALKNKLIAQSALALDQTKSFHLTSINHKYGFIDAELNTKIDFVYDEARPFNNLNFAEVKQNGVDYLIDTLGNKYKLAKSSNYFYHYTDSTILALDLRNKKLDSLEWLYIKNNKQVKILMLGDNQLQNFPIISLPNLFYLDLSNNIFRSFPEENIDLLTSLTTLDLSINGLTTISKNIGNLKNLVSLDLSENNLTGLPEEIGKLIKLSNLNLEGNRISKADSIKIKNLLPNTSINFGINENGESPIFSRRKSTKEELQQRRKKRTKMMIIASSINAAIVPLVLKLLIKKE